METAKKRNGTDPTLFYKRKKLKRNENTNI